MYTVLTTKEIASKTGLNERSVRRRLTNSNIFGPTVMMLKGKQVTYGATVEGVNKWLAEDSNNRLVKNN